MTPGQAADPMLRHRVRLESMSRTQAEIIYQALKKVLDRVEEKVFRGEKWPWRGLLDGEQRLRLQRFRAIEAEIKEWSDEAREELFAHMERRAGALMGILTSLAAAVLAGSKDRPIKPEPFNNSEVESAFETSVGGRSLRVWIQRAFSNQADRIRRLISHIGTAGSEVTKALGALRRQIVKFCKQTARTLARTILNAMFNRVNDKLFEKNGVDRVVYSGVLDDRTCWRCRKLFGKVFDVNDPRRPSIPQHPNCRCFYVPYVPKTKGIAGGL